MQEPSPINWAVRPLVKYSNFKGRAPRAEYWWFVLGSSIAGLVLALVDARIAKPILANYGPLRLSLTLALLLPTYAVTVRRLHDTDETAWWILPRIASSLLLLVPLLHVDASTFEQLSGWFIAALVVLGLGWVCAEITLFVFMISPGTQGPNQYGADPYGPDELEQIFA